jgi:TonB-dependent receptor
MSHRQGRSASRGASGWPQGLAGLMATVSVLALAGLAHAADAAADTTPTAVGAVVVTAAPRQEAAARAVEQAAPNEVRVQAAETILKYPDFNAAEALGRVPDISLSSDTGEGRFVQIRGIDANLDGATYGGIPLLNTNPGGTAAGGGGRAVEYDTIPTGAIDGIVVTLTGRPDHEAEGLGGSIELSPRTAANIEKPFVDLSAGGGYEPLHEHGGPYDGEVAVGARFGIGDDGLVWQNGQDLAPRAGFISNPTPFSFVLTASLREDRRAIDDLEESYIDKPGAPSNSISQYDLRRYDYHRARFGYGGEFDFEPNDDHRWYVRADIAGYQEAVHKNFLLFKNLDDVFNNTGVEPPDPSNPRGFLVTTTPQIDLTDEQETHRNQVYVIGGVDTFGDLKIDYHAAYSRATFYESRNIGAKFNGPDDVAIAYDNVTTPNFPIFTLPTGFDLNNAANYTLSSLSNEFDVDVDQEWSYAGNAAFPIRLMQADDQVKLGVEVRMRAKSASEFDANVDAPALSLAGLSFPALQYYDGHYTNGPQINLYGVRKLIAGNTTSYSFNPGSFFNANENIYAGYAQYTAQWGKLGLLAGVRVEATDALYGGYIQTTNPDGSAGPNVFERRPNDYINAFPTVQLKWSFTPQLVARATYSTGIARPGFEQNSTAASVDLSSSPLLITRGNPALQPTLGQTFDLDLEAYLPDGGVAEIGLFDKEFTNYIVPRIQNGITTDPLAPGQLANVTTFLNIPSAWARGVDLDYHQKFVFLPHPFNGLGIESNLTLVDSEIVEYTAAQSLTGQAERGLLPGTSQVTWNLAGFYEAYGLDLRLAAEYVSHSLFGLGGDKTLDTIQDDRLTLDFTSAYQVDKHWQVYFNAKNLLNTPLRYYEGESNRPIQREFYDVTFEAGVRAHF